MRSIKEKLKFLERDYQNYESPFINYVFKYLNYLQLISIGQSFNNVIKVLFKYIIVFLFRIHALTSQSKFADQIERLSMDRLIDIEPNLRKTVSGTKLYRWAGFPSSLADYFHRYVKITYIISVTFNLINVNHVNCRPKKKFPPQKGVQLRLDVVYLMQRERERERICSFWSAEQLRKQRWERSAEERGEE